MPAIFGNALATHVLSEIAQQPFEPYFQNEFEIKDLGKLMTNLWNNEIKFAKKWNEVPNEIDLEIKDIWFLLDVVYEW